MVKDFLLIIMHTHWSYTIDTLLFLFFFLLINRILDIKKPPCHAFNGCIEFHSEDIICVNEFPVRQAETNL